MAATFVVEDGTGLSTANAYVTEANADQYHENYGNPSAWTDLTSAQKQQYIREATRYLDSVYALQWIGDRKESGQALDWPRAFAEDPDGFLRDDDSVPQEVQDACSLLALKAVSDTLLVDLSSPSGNIVRDRTKVGEIEIETQYGGGSTNQKRYSLIEGLLLPLLANRNRVYRA